MKIDKSLADDLLNMVIWKPKWNLPTRVFVELGDVKFSSSFTFEKAITYKFKRKDEDTVRILVKLEALND